jgi:hypothetical protein
MLGSSGSGGEVLGDGLSGLPVVGEEFLAPLSWMGTDTLENVTETSEQVILISLARGDAAGEEGSGSRTLIASEEEPVLPSDGDSPQA